MKRRRKSKFKQLFSLELQEGTRMAWKSAYLKSKHGVSSTDDPSGKADSVSVAGCQCGFACISDVRMRRNPCNRRMPGRARGNEITLRCLECGASWQSSVGRLRGGVDEAVDISVAEVARS